MWGEALSGLPFIVPWYRIYRPLRASWNRARRQVRSVERDVLAIDAPPPKHLFTNEG